MRTVPRVSTLHEWDPFVVELLWEMAYRKGCGPPDGKQLSVTGIRVSGPRQLLAEEWRALPWQKMADSARHDVFKRVKAAEHGEEGA